MVLFKDTKILLFMRNNFGKRQVITVKSIMLKDFRIHSKFSTYKEKDFFLNYNDSNMNFFRTKSSETTLFPMH